MQKLTVIALLITLLLSGCDFVRSINPFAKKEDPMEALQLREDSIRRAEMLLRQQEEARLAEARADSLRRAQEAEALAAQTRNRYHLIVGAFKTPAYAEDFHQKILAQGHDSRIIMSENNFHLVTIRSHEDYRTAVNEWRGIRGEGEHLVWLYIKDI